MGIIVTDGTLPSGIPLTNVYMSFSGEPVYVLKDGDVWKIHSYYSVFSDPSKSNGSNIRVNLTTTTSNIAEGSPYYFLYCALKMLYPNNIDSV